jgi:bis(5'-nucleosyl)-tetraphosphatase (symmetrical)
VATYVVGDIQGCFEALNRLLTLAGFDAASDTLWSVGDLVNRGTQNLETLRFFKQLGKRAVCVLGNHDIHLLAVAAGVRPLGKKDTLMDVLDAPDKAELLTWLRQCPLVHQQGPYIMSHAGIPHIWTSQQAVQFGQEVSLGLSGPDQTETLKSLFNPSPPQWHFDLAREERLCCIVNYLTRMRFVTPQGQLNLDSKEAPEICPQGFAPWYLHPRAPVDKYTVFLFGHWAALMGKTGQPRFIGLDTGCVWGDSLTLLRLDDNHYFRVPAQVQPIQQLPLVSQKAPV